MDGEKRTSLVSRMEQLEIYLAELDKKKKKKFKLGRKLEKLSKVKLKQNYIIVLYLRTNGTILINQYKIEDEKIFIKESGLYHSVTTDSILNYNGKPFVIQPEWSLTPIIPREHALKTQEKGESALPQKVILELSEAGKIKKKSALPFSGKIALLILVAVVFIAYTLSKLFGG